MPAVPGSHDSGIWCFIDFFRGKFRVRRLNSRSFVYAKLCSDTACRAERARQLIPLRNRKHRRFPHMCSPGTAGTVTLADKSMRRRPSEGIAVIPRSDGGPSAGRVPRERPVSERVSMVETSEFRTRAEAKPEADRWNSRSPKPGRTQHALVRPYLPALHSPGHAAI